MTWNDINLQQFRQISTILTQDLEIADKASKLMDVLYPGRYQKVSAVLRTTLFNTEYDFLKTELPEVTATGYKDLNLMSANEITMGQFIDYVNYTKANTLDNVTKVNRILSVFLVPEGKEYGTYDLEETFIKIWTMPTPLAFSISKKINTEINALMKKFPMVFNADEDEEDEQTIQPASKLAAFGFMPFVFEVCELTNETMTNVLKMPAAQVFYLSTYLVVRSEEQKKMQERWKRTH